MQGQTEALTIFAVRLRCKDLYGEITLAFPRATLDHAGHDVRLVPGTIGDKADIHEAVQRMWRDSRQTTCHCATLMRSDAFCYAFCSVV